MFYISLWASKIWYFFTKRFSTSDRCGMVALRLYDNFLQKVSKPKLVIAVTGTNGKTTTCNFLVDMFTKAGYKVTSNREGANLRPGISKALMRGVTIFNKSKVDVAILEFDELSSKIILPLIKPNYVLVTNLFRDTLKRNGHTEYVYNKLNVGIPEYSTLVLNADDLISSTLGSDKNKKVFFGIKKLETEEQFSKSNTQDIRLCPKCNNELTFDFIRYHHIGKAHCSNCNFSSFDADYEITKIDEKKKTMVLNGIEYPLVSTSIINVYNLLCAVAILKEVGISDDTIKDTINSLNIVETRYKSFKKGKTEVIAHFVKGDNPVPASRVFKYIESLEGNINVILIIDDQHEIIKNGTSEFMSWMYDADYEFLTNPNVKRVIVGGHRMYDEKVRLLMAGLNEEKIFVTEKEEETTKFIDYKNVDKIVVLYDLYSMDLCKKVLERIEGDLK